MPEFSSVNGVFPVLSSFTPGRYPDDGHKHQEETMNWDQVQGKWKQMKGQAKTRWGKLTDDDLDVIAGQKAQLVGRLQERYGSQTDQAQREVDEWNDELGREPEYQRERQRRRGGPVPAIGFEPPRPACEGGRFFFCFFGRNLN